MDFQLPPALHAWHMHMRRFVQDELQPYDQEIEHSGHIPPAVLESMRQAGLFGINTPVSYGGLGHSMLGMCLAVEELAKAHIAYYYTCGVNIHLGSKGIEFGGSDAQRQRWLPELASGRMISAFALTEPEAGSDAAGLQTTAVYDGESYVLNGVKRYITNAPIADIFTVFASTAPGQRSRGISAFLVEANTPGSPSKHRRRCWQDAAPPMRRGAGSIVVSRCRTA